MFDPIQMHGIIRYANRVRIKDEDLAQHSYSVAYYCFDIAYDYDIPDKIRNEAIAMAIIHDIGECFTSDLPHDVKYENPELKDLCEKLERKYVDKLPSCRELWYKFQDNDSIQSIMVKLGDSLSAKSYVERELALGNNTDVMKNIQKEIEARIPVFKDKLKNRMEQFNYGENK